MESVDQVLKDSYCPTWGSSATNTLTTDGTADIEFDDFTDTYKLVRRPSADVAVLVASKSGSGKPTLDYSCMGKKYLWRRTASHRLAYTAGIMPIIFQVIEEDLGFPEEAVGSVSPWPALWRCKQPEPTDLRGVFPTNYPRKVLFTKQVTFKTSELPRWKPKKIIGLRTFEEEDA